MTHRLCSHLMVVGLFLVGFTLTACETTPLNPREELPDNPGVATEISKPLAVVNQAMPEALERCGYVIDSRQFVDGVVELEAAAEDGTRVSIRLKSTLPETTRVEVLPAAGHPAEGVMLQMVSVIRDVVWK